MITLDVKSTSSPSPPVMQAESADRTTTSTTQPQQQQQQQPLKFSVENILDPTKFTGQPVPSATPLRNNNFFQTHHLFSHHHANPWLLPVNPGHLLHHHQQHSHHHVELHSTSVDSINEEDSLYDRSDLGSGNETLFSLFSLFSFLVVSSQNSK